MSGGPEKYLFSIQNKLRQEGHEVLPFSVQSSRNLPCEHQERFLSPIGDDAAVYAHEYKKTPRTVLKALSRQFYSPEAFFKAHSFAKFTQADLVYSLQFLNKMSPALLDGFKSADLPVVLRVSDFGLICPQAHLFDGRAPCTKCIGGNFTHAIKQRCVMGSRAASLVKGAALTVHRLLRCRNRIDAFVFPSRFTLERFVEAGFPYEKMHYIPTSIDVSLTEPHYEAKDGTILYVGRVVIEKGVHQLCEAYRNIKGSKPRLVIIGAQTGETYADRLMEQYGQEIAFHPFMSQQELKAYIAEALCVVVPSIWYDNQPNVLLEAYAYGKPVLAPNHGCFTDLVKDGETGLLYQAGNASDLCDKLKWVITHGHDMETMGREARRVVEQDYTPEGHTKKLLSVFSSVV